MRPNALEEMFMAHEIYNDGTHRCLAYRDLTTGAGVQANQFLIIDGAHGALLDPGGDMTYAGLFEAMNGELAGGELDFIMCSHQDPDIVSSLARWVSMSQCKVVVPAAWARFVPHICRPAKGMRLESRIVSIPDEGTVLSLGDATLLALPAHYLHSEGNFQLYDPVAKVLFSGDLGAAFNVESDLDRPVGDFERHIRAMEPFHRRYMGGNKVCRLWADMVSELDLQWVVPQHGPPFRGREVIDQFIDWVANLECGTDLLSKDDYRLPRGIGVAPRPSPGPH
jgi:flavorubredoxin